MPDIAALVPALGVSSWILVTLGALVVGFSKAALPGAGTIAVGLFALAMPAKESTAALLLLLIVGDLTALWVYRREPDLKMLVRLIPSVIDRKSTRLNSSHVATSYAVFCLKTNTTASPPDANRDRRAATA